MAFVPSADAAQLTNRIPAHRRPHRHAVPITPRLAAVAALAIPISLIPAAFHRHAAAAAANPSSKGLAFASVGISHLQLLVTIRPMSLPPMPPTLPSPPHQMAAATSKGRASELVCATLACFLPPLMLRRAAPCAAAGLGGGAAIFVGDDDDDDDKPHPRRQYRLLPSLFDHHAAAAAAAKTLSAASRVASLTSTESPL